MRAASRDADREVETLAAPALNPQDFSQGPGQFHGETHSSHSKVRLIQSSLDSRLGDATLCDEQPAANKLYALQPLYSRLFFSAIVAHFSSETDFDFEGSKRRWREARKESNARESRLLII